MSPITIPAPSPGKHTIRIPLDPQPFMVLEESEWHSRAMSGCDPYGFRPMGSWTPETLLASSPYKPGETYWVREVWQTVYMDETDGDLFAGDLALYFSGWEDEAVEPHEVDWQPADTMPQWASRFTARCLSVTLEHGDGWQWRVEIEVTTNTRSE